MKKGKLVAAMAAVVLGASLILAGCGGSGNGGGAKEQNTSETKGAAENNAGDGASAFALPEGTKVTGTMPSFATEDLTGKTYTQDLFAGKDITMVNVWGTFCGPCMKEMPSLEQLSKALPDNAQIIGILCDVSLNDKSSLAAGVQIVEDAGVTFPSLLLDTNLGAFTQQFMFVPTTVFVDSQGNILDDPVVGAVFDSYVERMEQYLPGWTFN